MDLLKQGKFNGLISGNGIFMESRENLTILSKNFIMCEHHIYRNTMLDISGYLNKDI